MAATEFEISPAEAIDRSFDAVYDIRYAPTDQSLPGAIAVDYGDLVAGALLPDADATILVVCDIGVRSKQAVLALRALGYEHTLSLAGGADALRNHRSQTGNDALSAVETERYDRQTRLAGFGVQGQQRLSRATVAVVGAGGLGSPVLTYLAAAGIGSITVVDHDTVELSNLQRQPIYRTEDVDRAKVSATHDSLKGLNPLVRVNAIADKLTAANAAELIEHADVVVDATDTFEARYALNAATVVAGKPLVYGSVYGFEGQTATFDATQGPCYRCVFPRPPADDAALDCATIGVLGAVTGVIGSLQASAALQIAAGVPHDLFGHLTLFDARTSRFDRMEVSKRSACADCGRS